MSNKTPAAECDFGQLARVLDRKKPDRPILFEFFLNIPLYRKLADSAVAKQYENQEIAWNALHPVVVSAFANAGYEHVTAAGSDFAFPMEEVEQKDSRSINEGGMISNRDDFNSYAWPDPDAFDYSGLETCKLPKGMKVIVFGPGGVLEDVIGLVGYEKLCMMLVDDPKLAGDIFNAVGERLVRYYKLSAAHDNVGALISNDDWGYKTQTMLSPIDMRKYVFPWHKKIVQAIHDAGKYAILHSCGQLIDVMDDIINDMKYDGKHSYEDVIMPVEQAYDKWNKRIAILGGIDLDFVCVSTPQQIRQRCEQMLQKTAQSGSYALGTGNSVPEYVPEENYLAMIDTVKVQ